MTSTTCELFWLKQLPKELQFGDVTKMTLICDNQDVFHTSYNLIVHEKTKHIEILSFYSRKDCIWRHQDSIC